MVLRVLPPRFGSHSEAIRQICERINAIGRGRSNAGGRFTLHDGVDSTQVVDSHVGAESVISLTPLTSAAAAALPQTYIDTIANGQFTVKHTVATGANRMFGYMIQG